MSSINDKNNIKSIKSPKLQGVIVEPILVYCINGISICELSFEIQRVIPLPYKALKKYLFYLINYELLSYDGQRQIYITEDVGLDLLDKIGEEKRITMINSEDIVITLE
jgi:predicted transcriptional regulator